MGPNTSDQPPKWWLCLENPKLVSKSPSAPSPPALQAQLPTDGEIKNQLLADFLELNLQIVVSFALPDATKTRKKKIKILFIFIFLLIHRTTIRKK